MPENLPHNTGPVERNGILWPISNIISMGILLYFIVCSYTTSVGGFHLKNKINRMVSLHCGVQSNSSVFQ